MPILIQKQLKEILNYDQETGIFIWLISNKLGYFQKEEDAYAIYCDAAKTYFGEFARFA